MNSSSVDRGPSTAIESFSAVGPSSTILGQKNLGLAGGHPFVFHHRLDLIALVGTPLAIVMVLIPKGLPIESLGISTPILQEFNIGGFILLFVLTLLLSTYWFVQVFQNSELAGSRFGRRWPNVLVIWMSLLALNCGPFLLATSIDARIHNGQVTTTLYGGQTPWDGVPLLIYILALGFAAYAFKIHKSRGFAESILGLGLAVLIWTAYIVIFVNFGNQISLFFLNDLLWTPNVLNPMLGFVSVFVIWLCLLYPYVLALGGWPTSRFCRVCFLAAVWSMPAVIATFVVASYILLSLGLHWFEHSAAYPYIAIATGVALSLLVEPILHRWGNTIWALPRR
jgi:hypothetical protein